MRKFRIETRGDGDGSTTHLFEGDKEIMSGDWYHDKIEEQIQGFFHALEYLGIEHKVVDTEDEEEDYSEVYNLSCGCCSCCGCMCGYDEDGREDDTRL